jgi:carbonic anhydrase/acetyltransferase-like protein (isoleucine patch superfamily)
VIARQACRIRNGIRSRICRARGGLWRRLLFGISSGPLLAGKGLIVVGGHRIRVGAGVSLSDNVWLNCENADSPIPPGPRIEIGDRVGIGRGTVISAAARVTIDSGVVLAPNVLITDHQHASDDPLRPIAEQGITPPAPVRLREGAWIGTNAVLLPGVTVGRNAVVGANSVVTRDVPDFSVVVGAPAQPVRAPAPVP